MNVSNLPGWPEAWLLGPNTGPVEPIVVDAPMEPAPGPEGTEKRTGDHEDQGHGA